MQSKRKPGPKPKPKPYAHAVIKGHTYNTDTITYSSKLGYQEVPAGTHVFIDLMVNVNALAQLEHVAKAARKAIQEHFNALILAREAFKQIKDDKKNKRQKA